MAAAKRYHRFSRSFQRFFDFVEELTAEAEQEPERIATLPSYQPSKSEYDEHCVTHCPYRPWCRHCAEGRGQEFGHHRRKEHDPNRVPMLAFDYALYQIARKKT